MLFFVLRVKFLKVFEQRNTDGAGQYAFYADFLFAVIRASAGTVRHRAQRRIAASCLFGRFFNYRDNLFFALCRIEAAR